MLHVTSPLKDKLHHECQWKGQFRASISHKKYASLSTKVTCLMHKGLTSIIQR